MCILIFRHNCTNRRHEQCLYDPKYSNIISGLRMPKQFTMEGNGAKVVFRIKGKTLRKIARHDNGLWIKPDNKAAAWKCAGIHRMSSEGKEEAKELHERYGHISYKTLQILPDYPKNVGQEKIRCEPCEHGKATKPSTHKRQKKLQIRTNRIL